MLILIEANYLKRYFLQARKFHNFDLTDSGFCYLILYKGKPDNMQFDQIHLYTPLPGILKEFYTSLLGQEAVRYDTARLFLQIGHTEVVFYTSETPATYHFAINCAYQIVESIPGFVKTFSEILPGPHDEEIIEFPNWNARSVYFRDPAGNIVEIIGRQRMQYALKDKSEKPVFHCVSELGLATPNFAKIREKVNRNLQLEEFWVEGDYFIALGDEEGLLITVDSEQKLWFPSNTRAGFFGWTTRLTIKGQPYQLRYDGADIFVRKIIA